MDVRVGNERFVRHYRRIRLVIVTGPTATARRAVVTDPEVHRVELVERA